MSGPTGGELLAEGRGAHQHIDPDRAGFPAARHGWNSVVKSPCGHLFVRRHSLGWILPLGDHWPQWVRLRPWHLGALARLAVPR